MNYVALHKGKKSVSEIKTDGVLLKIRRNSSAERSTLRKARQALSETRKRTFFFSTMTL